MFGEGGLKTEENSTNDKFRSEMISFTFFPLEIPLPKLPRIPPNLHLVLLRIFHGGNGLVIWRLNTETDYIFTAEQSKCELK